MTGAKAWDPLEEWRTVGEGAYEVSSHGRLRRTKSGRLLRPGLASSGYLSATLSVRGNRRSRAVHRLVAEAFLGPRAEGLEVNHVDGCKTNNAAVNLEYTTRSENALHALRIGLYQPARGDRSGSRTHPKLGEASGASKLTEQQARDIMANSLLCRVTRSELARAYGVHPSTVSLIVTRKRWTHLWPMVPDVT